MPWINADLKRLVYNRDKYFKIKNITHTLREIENHKSLKTEVHRIQQAHWDYVKSMFEQLDGESNNYLQQDQRSTCKKWFWSFLNYARTDKSGITSLKEGDLLLTNSSSKADL